MKLASCGLLLGLTIKMAGCARLIAPPIPFTIHDLGPVEAAMSAPAFVPASIDVEAPTWLSTSAMQYRLEYVDSSGRAAYGENRWAGHPAEMLQRSLSARLTGNAAGSGRCRLRLELDEFVQRFDAADVSRAELMVRATVIAPRDEAVLARRSFTAEAEAPTPDARGGVKAHRQAVRMFSDQLSGWLDALGRNSDGGVAERCMR